MLVLHFIFHLPLQLWILIYGAVDDVTPRTFKYLFNRFVCAWLSGDDLNDIFDSFFIFFSHSDVKSRLSVIPVWQDCKLDQKHSYFWSFGFIFATFSRKKDKCATFLCFFYFRNRYVFSNLWKFLWLLTNSNTDSTSVKNDHLRMELLLDCCYIIRDTRARDLFVSVYLIFSWITFFSLFRGFPNTLICSDVSHFIGFGRFQSVAFQSRKSRCFWLCCCMGFVQRGQMCFFLIQPFIFDRGGEADFEASFSYF